MAALDFPSSPSTGAIFSSDSLTWTYDGSMWRLAGNVSDGVFNGVPLNATTHKAYIATGTHEATTGGFGTTTITFGVTFAVPPIVVATIDGSLNVTNYCFNYGAATTTTQPMSTGTGNTAIRMFWTAIGTIAV